MNQSNDGKQTNDKQQQHSTDCFSRKSYSALFVYDKKTRWLDLSDYMTWKWIFQLFEIPLLSSCACKLLISKKQNIISQFTSLLIRNHELLSWIEHDWLLQAWSWIGILQTTQLLNSSIIAWSSTFYVT